MKILVVSDSHGNIVALNGILKKEAPFDWLVHCGDGVNDLLHAAIRPAMGTIAVSGNVDLARGATHERIVVERMGGRDFLVTHGDIQRAHEDYLGLADEGKRRGCSVVLFGHTHRQYLGGGKPLLFNPGPALNGLYGIILMNGGMELLHRRLE
ncbi:MAG: YfcE family phosphodiesterase [Spirochaetes bacterium]|nr:YfcE family phosphodiesterase [Spirochaetota bacterium]